MGEYCLCLRKIQWGSFPNSKTLERWFQLRPGPASELWSCSSLPSRIRQKWRAKMILLNSSGEEAETHQTLMKEVFNLKIYNKLSYCPMNCFFPRHKYFYFLVSWKSPWIRWSFWNVNWSLGFFLALSQTNVGEGDQREIEEPPPHYHGGNFIRKRCHG